LHPIDITSIIAVSMYSGVPAVATPGATMRTRLLAFSLGGGDEGKVVFFTAEAMGAYLRSVPTR
jgi:hypothetical protein